MANAGKLSSITNVKPNVRCLACCQLSKPSKVMLISNLPSPIFRPPISAFQHFSFSAFARVDFSFSAFALDSFSFLAVPPPRQAGRTALLWSTHLCFQHFSFSAFQLFSFCPSRFQHFSMSAFQLLPGQFVEVGTPVVRRPPHRSRRAVFPHRALQVNSLSHEPSGLSPAAENPATVGRNSVPSGKAFPSYTSPQCAVSALGNGPASD